MELQYKTVEFADIKCDWEKRWVGKEATLDYGYLVKCEDSD